MIFLNTPVQALINPGSTHSFISYALARYLGLELRELSCPMIVAIPLGKQVRTYTDYKDGWILLGNNEFMVELTSLGIQDFDLILGMDFLSKHNAKIDCQAKIVDL